MLFSDNRGLVLCSNQKSLSEWVTDKVTNSMELIWPAKKTNIIICIVRLPFALHPGKLRAWLQLSREDIFNSPAADGNQSSVYL